MNGSIAPIRRRLLQPTLLLLWVALCVLALTLASEGKVPGNTTLHGWAAFGFVVLAGWLGWVFRQSWVYPRRFRRAEALWEANASPNDVLKVLDRCPLATGELGYRIHLLRSKAHLSAGRRPQAWQASLRAGLARLPFHGRWALTLYLHLTPFLQEKTRHTLGNAFGRHLRWPDRFHHILAVQTLRGATPADEEQGWGWVQKALRGGQEDPLVLEDLMLASLGRLQAEESHPPYVEEVFHSSMKQLLYHHGEPRIPWDRVSPAAYLLRKGRIPDCLLLVQSLPPGRRPQTLWEIGAIGLRELDRTATAEDFVRQGLLHFPESFRLWMEHHTYALQRRDDSLAKSAMEKALSFVPGADDPDEARWEWLLRRAEFAYWIEGDPLQAWNLLIQVPEGHQGRHHPPLLLQLQVALGQHSEAYPTIQALVQRRPKDPDLLLLQADCMAAMGTWEALFPSLESIQTICGHRSDYWHLLGLCHAHLQQRIPARDCLLRAAIMDPELIRYLLDAGHACMELADWDQAESHWRQALRLEPQNYEALINLAETRRALHDSTGAKAILRECILAHPDSEEAQGYLAELEAN